MLQYECVQVNHHQDIGPAVEKYVDDGWQLHTYQAAGDRSMGGIKHYLLFEKEG